MKVRLLTLAIATITSTGGLALAQAPAQTPPGPAAIFTEPEFEQFARTVRGSWKTTEPIKVMGGGLNESVGLVMSIAPVGVSGIPNAFYVEIARDNQVHRPFRQCLWRLYKAGGKAHLQTLEFRRSRGAAMQLAGMWAAPDAFPVSITVDDVVATADLELAGKDGAWTGATAHPFPTFTGGAASMTSQISVSADRIEVTDTGFDAAGAKAWGGDKTAFARTDLGVSVTRHNMGVIVIDYPANVTGNPAAAGDAVSVHYVGYLGDGRVFDSSYDRGMPLTYAEGRTFAVKGWPGAMANARRGMQRRVIIPPQMAYGAAGDMALNIPPHATLIYDVTVVSVAPATAPVQPTPGAGPQDPGEQQRQLMEKQRLMQEQEDKARKAQEHGQPK